MGWEIQVIGLATSATTKRHTESRRSVKLTHNGSISKQTWEDTQMVCVGAYENLDAVFGDKIAAGSRIVECSH